MPTLASTSRVQLAYVKESSFQVMPGSGSRNLRMTGETMDFSVTKTDAPEIRSDRQVSGTTTTDAQVTGGFNANLLYAEYDQLLEGCMQQLYSVYGTQGLGTTFTATYTTTTITASVAPTGSSAFTSLQGGQWFRMTSPGDANDGKLFRVSTSVAPTTTVITLDASTPATVAAGIANCLVATSRLSNGTSLMTFAIEEQYLDITQFLMYKGMGVNKLSLALSTAALANLTADFIGASMTRLGATSLPGSVALSQTYNVMNTAKGIGALWENGAPVTSTFIKTMNLDISNNLRGQKALGTLGNAGLGSGDFSVTGTMDVYFADGTIYDRFLNDTYTSLVVAARDPSGNGYVLSMPHVMLTTGKVTAGAKNQDAMISFGFTAYSDDTNATAALRKSLFIDRVGVAAQ